MVKRVPSSLALKDESLEVKGMSMPVGVVELSLYSLRMRYSFLFFVNVQYLTLQIPGKK